MKVFCLEGNEVGFLCLWTVRLKSCFKQCSIAHDRGLWSEWIGQQYYCQFLTFSEAHSKESMEENNRTSALSAAVLPGLNVQQMVESSYAWRITAAYSKIFPFSSSSRNKSSRSYTGHFFFFLEILSASPCNLAFGIFGWVWILVCFGGGEGGGKNEKYVKEMEGYCFPAVLDETHGSVPLELRSLVAESRFVLGTHQLKKAQMTWIFHKESNFLV